MTRCVIHLALVILLAPFHAAVAGPVLYFTEQGSGQCDWKVWDLSKPKADVLLTTKLCPEMAIWSLAKKKVFFKVGDELYQADWPGKVASVEKVFETNDTLKRFWIAPSGRLRVAYIFRDSEGCESQQISGDSLSGWNCRGNSITNVAVDEQTEGKTWVRIAVGKTNRKSEYEIGYDSVKDHMVPDGKVLSAPEPSNEVMSSFSPQVDLATIDNNLGPIANARVVSLENCAGDCDAWGRGLTYFPLGKNSAMVIGAVADGCTTQTRPGPVVLCSDLCSKKQVVTGTEGKNFSWIDIREDFVLLADWEEFFLLKAGNANPLVRTKSKVAFWANP